MRAIILILAGFTIGFLAALAWLSESTYETGRKMALMSVQQALNEGLQGRHTFHLHGIEGIEFRPMRRGDGYVIAGAGSER